MGSDQAPRQVLPIRCDALAVMMVCTDRRVRRRFRDHVYLVTMGRDVRGAAAVAAKVNDVIKLVEGEDATFTDPDLAGARLGALLDTGHDGC